MFAKFPKIGSLIVFAFITFSTSGGSYIGIITLTLGSGEGCSKKSC